MCLESSIKEEKTNNFEELLSLKSKVDIQILLSACSNGDINSAKFVLSQQMKNLNPEKLNESLCLAFPTDLACHNNCCIGLASQYGHIEIVKILMKNIPPVDPSANNNHALRIAEECEFNEIVELLHVNKRVLQQCSYSQGI